MRNSEGIAGWRLAAALLVLALGSAVLLGAADAAGEPQQLCGQFKPILA